MGTPSVLTSAVSCHLIVPRSSTSVLAMVLNTISTARSFVGRHPCPLRLPTRTRLKAKSCSPRGRRQTSARIPLHGGSRFFFLFLRNFSHRFEFRADEI